MQRRPPGNRARARVPGPGGRKPGAIDWGERGLALEAEGKAIEAEQAYRKAVDLHPRSSAAWYNLGLFYKRRRQWGDSLRANREAAALDPRDQASWWNLGIAATALGDWGEARRAWRGAGVPLPEGEGPIELVLGPVPIRLDPGSRGEVVWCRRLDPARAVIENIPLPDSGHRYGDLLLHDGSPTGHREIDGHRVPLFDEIEILQPSVYSTYRVSVEAPGEADVEALRGLLGAAEGALEDWTSSLRVLCRACSEGTPHEVHEGERAGWVPSRELGIAARRAGEVEEALGRWVAGGSGRSFGGAERVVEGALRS